MSRHAPLAYPWPASALTAAGMAVLVSVRAETNRPITVLLREAVHLAYGARGSTVREVRP